MFHLTDTNEYGHLDVVDTFDTVEEAELALQLLELALEDDGPTYRIHCAIDELKEQLDNYYASL